MDEEKEQLQQLIKVGGWTLGIVGLIIVLIFVQHSWSTKRAGTIVLPGGVTYLGPSPTIAPSSSGSSTTRFTADDSVAWKKIKGIKYPYTLSVPETLPIVTFPDDPYDMKAVFWQNQPAQSNILIGVDNLSQDEKKKQYVGRPKKEYVENWWRQFSGLTGIQSISPFTNSEGLDGYKVTFKTASGTSPYQDVFLVPPQNNIVIHLSNSIVDEPIFDKIVDSVGWEQ